MAFVLGLAVSPAFAEDQKVEGTVKVTKVEAEVKSIEVTVGEKTYAVKLDDNGKKVAEHDGKVVIITGEVSEANEITVKSVEKKEEEKEAEEE